VADQNTSQPVIGSVEISNASLNVDVTIGDYLSIVGSPNYSLPVIGSAQVSSIVGALPAGTNIIGNIGSIGAGILGSVQVSSIVGALPAGTALLGSVVADIVGLSTSDYVSIVGSPNYNLSIIGSVQVSSVSSLLGSVEVSSIRNPLPTGTNTIGSIGIIGTISTGSGMVIYSGAVTNVVDVTTGRLATQTLGSVQVSSLVAALPAGTALIGSVVAAVINPSLAAGSRLNDHATVVAVAAGAGSSSYFTPPNGFRLQQVELAATGEAKMQVGIGSPTIGLIYTTAFNTASNRTVPITFAQPIVIPNGSIVTRTLINREITLAQDMYSFVNGFVETA